MEGLDEMMNEAKVELQEVRVCEEVENMVTAKKQFTKIGLFYLIATVAITLVQMVLGKIITGRNPEALKQVNTILLISVASMYLFGFPLLAFLMIRFVPAKKVERHKIKPGEYVLAAVMCIGLAYLSNLAGNMITIFVGKIKGSPVENVMMNLTAEMSPVIILLYMVIAAPILEELFFRKLIVERTIVYGDWIAILTSGLMFGLFHGNLNQFVYAMVIGMFLAYLYAKTGNLKITISLHMLFNFIGGFLSSQLIKAIDLVAYTEAAASGDYMSLVNVMQQNIWAWVGYLVFTLFVYGMMIAGTVIFIVFLTTKRFKFRKGEIELPKKLKYCVVFGNFGMLTFLAFWIITITRQLLV